MAQSLEKGSGMLFMSFSLVSVGKLVLLDLRQPERIRVAAGADVHHRQLDDTYRRDLRSHCPDSDLITKLA